MGESRFYFLGHVESLTEYNVVYHSTQWSSFLLLYYLFRFSSLVSNSYFILFFTSIIYENSAIDIGGFFGFVGSLDFELLHNETFCNIFYYLFFKSEET
jgi:hypothetical protein